MSEINAFTLNFGISGLQHSSVLASSHLIPQNSFDSTNPTASDYTAGEKHKEITYTAEFQLEKMLLKRILFVYKNYAVGKK